MPKYMVELDNETSITITARTKRDARAKVQEAIETRESERKIVNVRLISGRERF